MDIWTKIAFTVALGILATRSEPMILLREWVGLSNDTHIPSHMLNFIKKLINCAWCLTFWLGLFLFGPVVGVIASGIGFLIDENF